MPQISPIKAQQALYKRGILTWKLHKGQKVIEDAYNKYFRKLFVSNCARRFGKTFWTSLKAVECAISCKNPLPRVKFAAATRTDLKEFAIPAFEQILSDCPPEIAPQWKASDTKYVFPHNGAEIQLIGLDKRPDGGRGNYVDLYIFEEAGFIKNLSYLYGSVVAPMTLNRPGSRVIMASTPPSTPDHDFQAFCERAQKQNSYAELNIYQNPMLAEKEIEEAHAECLDESEWLREYMCQFVVDKNKAIIPEWNDDCARAIERPAYFDFLHKYVAMDLGVKIDLTAILFGFYNPKVRTLYIEDEAEINGPAMTTIGLRDLVKKKERELWERALPYKRIADNDNRLLLQDLGYLHGLHFIPTGKDELHAMVNELRVFIKDGRLIIDPKCKKLLGCLRYGIWNDRRNSFKRSPLYGHYDHLAALVYLIRNLDQSSDPVPGIQHDEAVTFVKKKRTAKRLEESVKKLVNLKL